MIASSNKAQKLVQLEYARGFAACYVCFTHVLPLCGFGKGKFEIFLRFGQEAVMLFFLLSGFVIYFSFERAEDKSFKNYFLRRFLRIYPIFVISLLLGYLALCVSARNWVRLDIKSALANLCMLQDFSYAKPGVLFSPFAGNSPLWSLSYEWWFYMSFWPIVSWTPKKWQFPIVIAISAVGGIAYFLLPNQVALFALYFLIWWVGVEMARVFCSGRTPDFRNQAKPIIVLTLFCCVLLVPVIAHQGHLGFGLHPFLELRHFGAALGIVCIALVWSRFKLRFFNSVFGIFGFVAPLSFALYVVHYPIALACCSLPFINPSILRLVVCGVIAVSASFLAETLSRRLSLAVLPSRAKMEGKSGRPNQPVLP